MNSVSTSKQVLYQSSYACVTCNIITFTLDCSSVCKFSNALQLWGHTHNTVVITRMMLYSWNTVSHALILDCVISLFCFSLWRNGLSFLSVLILTILHINSNQFLKEVTYGRHLALHERNNRFHPWFLASLWCDKVTKCLCHLQIMQKYSWSIQLWKKNKALTFHWFFPFSRINIIHPLHPMTDTTSIFRNCQE